MLKKSISTLFLIACCSYSYAQLLTPFTIRNQATQKGGIRFISNSSVTCSGGTCGTDRNVLPPAGTGTNNGFTMVYIDADADAATIMSSSDSLALPQCSEITWAGLYWGASSVSTMANYGSRFSVRLKVNNGAYQTLTAPAADQKDYAATYTGFINITTIAKAAGINARFTVADLITDVGVMNKYGGWTIVVVYKNDLQPMRNLTVFNGLANVTGAAPTVDIPISGFLTPLSGPVTFDLGVMAYDGDRSSVGDSLKFNGAGSFVTVSDAIHPANDIFNSTLSYNAVLTSYRVPSYNNTLGYDANIFVPNNTAKNYIGNSATSATVRVTTGGETILASVVTSAIDIYEPDLRAAVKVTDLNAGSVQPGDTLEYTIICKNIGSDPSVNTFVTDTMEGNAHFVPGSINIIYGPNMGSKTDAATDDQGEYQAAGKTIKVRIGTGANATTGGTVLNSPSGIDSTVITFRVTTTTDCIYLQCDNVIDNRAYIFGTGNVSGNSFNNGSNPGIFDGNGCPIPGTTSSAINAALCSPPTASSSGPACIGGTINLFASTSSDATYAWTGPNGFTSAVANPIITNATAPMAGTYTVIISVTGTACATTLTTTVTVGSPTQTGEVAGSPGGGQVNQTHNVSVASGYYSDNTCNLISRVQASGGNPVTGNITSNVWIESAVPVYGGSPYVARHYEIVPATNPASATGTVILYFLQSEFNAFNAAPGSVLNLPTGASDPAGIANLRIGYYAGTSSNSSGLPSSYAGSSTVIDPANGGIVWNATAGRWEVTFNAVGFGGFVVQTSTFTLPVSFVSFTAEKYNKKVLLRWQTATEINTSHFVVEHSINGISFAAIGSVNAAGNSNGLLSYRFIHDNPQRGNNFYRLQQVDMDARINYSSIARIDFQAGNSDLIILVNPVGNGRLQVQFGRATIAFICNAQGQVIITQQVAIGQQTINVSDLPQGTYLLRAGDEAKMFIVK
jgi:uncharacterized repeat protein (TIGR01451 family)